MWDFGDGQISSDLSSNHTYEDFGSYTVTFEAQGDSGTTKQTKQITLVKALEIESVSYQLMEGQLSAQAEVAGGFTPYRYSWTIDNNSPVQTQSFDYQFSYSGDYIGASCNRCAVNVLIAKF
ncbi:PKD domain-containing protein (plasmid) [Pseudoalteromonas espejiana]